MTVYVAVTAATLLAVYHVGEIEWFFRGFGMVWENHDPRYRGYLLGEHGNFFASYFAVALLVKMPLGTLGLAGLGLLWRERDGAPLPWTERLLIAMPAALVFVVATVAARYLGVRYVLPCIPFIILMASRVTLIPWVRRWPGRLVPIAGCLGVATSVAFAWPDYIPYFNEAAGGSRGGVRILDDSNIDWGQDWYALADFQRERGIPELRCMPKNALNPGPVYGVAARPMVEEDVYLPKTGWYAVSAHLLTRDVLFSHDRAIRFDWLDAYRPVAVVGGSMYVYRFRVSHAAPSADFDGIHLTPDEQIRQGIARLERANEEIPSSGTLERLASLQLRDGRVEDARATIDRAVEQSKASVGKALVQLSRLDELPPRLQTAVVQRLEDETAEMTATAHHARAAFHPDGMLAALEASLGNMARYSRLAESVRSKAPWTGPAVAEIPLRRLVARARAQRFVLTGDPDDRGALEQAITVANKLAERRHDPERLVADEVVREARGELEAFRRRYPDAD